MSGLKERTLTGLLWNYAQNLGGQVVNFVVSIIIARILTPSEYGLVSLASVFTAITSVFVTTGFSAGIIQKKNVSKLELASVFYMNVMMGCVLYCMLFLFSPLIAKFCKEPAISSIIRVQGISCVMASLYSVPQSILLKKMDFKSIAKIRGIGVIIHGIVGITLAYFGFGAYALVISTVANNAIILILTFSIIRWFPMMEFSFSLIKEMVLYSSQVLGTNLINTLYNNISSLFIGRKYSSDQLGYYSRGYSFPSTLMVSLDGTISTVIFPTMSSIQDRQEEVNRILRRTIQISLFICAPVMIGLIAIAEPMIRVLLTDKWLDSAIYVKLMSVVCLSWPLSAGVQTLNALGLSRVTLRLSALEKIIGIVLLLITVGISVKWVAYSMIISTVIGVLLKAYSYMKYLQYDYINQIVDFFKPILISCLMFLPIYFINNLIENEIVKLFLDISIGIIVYVFASMLLNKNSIYWFISLISKTLVKRGD